MDYLKSHLPGALIMLGILIAVGFILFSKVKRTPPPPIGGPGTPIIKNQPPPGKGPPQQPGQ